MDREALRGKLVSRPVRIAALVLGAITWLVFGVSIFASLVSPRTVLDFWLAIYFGVAGTLAIIYFFSRRTWQLLVALPGVVYLAFGAVGLLMSLAQ